MADPLRIQTFIDMELLPVLIGIVYCIVQFVQYIGDQRDNKGFLYYTTNYDHNIR